MGEPKRFSGGPIDPRAHAVWVGLEAPAGYEADPPEPWDAVEAIRRSKDRLVIVRESLLCERCRNEAAQDMAAVSEALTEFAAEDEE